MGTKAMRRNLRQSIFKSLGRYIAIVMIIALGCCLFIGLLVTRKDMLATGEVYIAESQMYDFRMISTYGWDDDQVAKAARLEGVANAEGVFYHDLIASRKGESGVYRFYNIPDTINQVLLRGGRMPRNSEECLADGYLAGRSILGKKIVLSEENDPDSLLNFYREAIRLRKTLPVVRHGAYREHFPTNNQLYVYSRELPDEKLLVICSFREHDTVMKVPSGFDLSKAELILSNYENKQPFLQPYECRVYHWSK